MKARPTKGRSKVISHGKKPPEGGVTKGKMPKETTFQKDGCQLHFFPGRWFPSSTGRWHSIRIVTFDPQSEE